MEYLSSAQLAQKGRFIESYSQNTNAATASVLDPNANVESKNIATLEWELNKDIFIQLNRHLMVRKITEIAGKDVADKYLKQIADHLIYVHDETSLKPYCASVSLYPLLLNGTKSVGGTSPAPVDADSFALAFTELVQILSSQFAGAIATVEFLCYADYYLRKSYGPHYLTTHQSCTDRFFNNIVRTINQPACGRGFQGIFWNISLYDRDFFESIFENFHFPDGEVPEYGFVCTLQKYFMKWFNEARRKELLTFPVVTAAMLTKSGKPVSSSFSNFCASEMSEGNSFFIYMSDTADSLSGCCRLRSEMTDSAFSNTLGAGGVSTGSVRVMTLNMNRIIQRKVNLMAMLDDLYVYHHAFRLIRNEYEEAGLLPAYQAGFISAHKQYSTIGINGLTEAAESRGIHPGNNQTYRTFISSVLKTIYDRNKEASRRLGFLINTEFVPAENLGTKNAQWDKKDGLKVPRDCYNSYFYPVEDQDIDISDKFELHGQALSRYLDGGSALHLNMDEHLSQAQYLSLFALAARHGCQYFCINVRSTVCEDCSYIDKKTRKSCQKCGSENTVHATRVIGYLKKVSSFSGARQSEHSARHYHFRPES